MLCRRLTADNGHAGVGSCWSANRPVPSFCTWPHRLTECTRGLTSCVTRNRTYVTTGLRKVVNIFGRERKKECVVRVNEQHMVGTNQNSFIEMDEDDDIPLVDAIAQRYNFF